MANDDFFNQRATLVVAHPAHELRLLGWLGRVRPIVHALTDGRGRANVPRIARTAGIVDHLGCQRGELFGELTDSGIYASLLRHDHRPLLETVQRLTEAFVRDGVELVVVDAHEDAFLSHDVMNATVRAAVLAAADRLGHPIACYDYALEHDPRSCSDEQREGAVWLRLSKSELADKLDAANGYEEVRNEVREAFDSFGEEAFAVECLRPLRDLGTIHSPTEKPIYEVHGEEMVRQGAYDRVVRYTDHVLPLLERLANLAPITAAA